MGPTWCQPGADWAQVGPMLAPMNRAIWDVMAWCRQASLSHNELTHAHSDVADLVTSDDYY